MSAPGDLLGTGQVGVPTTAVNQLHRIKWRYGLATLCIGAGQGIAAVLEGV